MKWLLEKLEGLCDQEWGYYQLQNKPYEKFKIKQYICPYLTLTMCYMWKVWTTLTGPLIISWGKMMFSIRWTMIFEYSYAQFHQSSHVFLQTTDSFRPG
jgi:hypothetical protein